MWDVDAGQSPTNSVFMGLYDGGDDRDSVLAVFGPAIHALEAASAAGINWPYQYGAALPATNDASVRAFYAHPLVKADRARSTCVRACACAMSRDRGAVLTRLLARAPGPSHAKLPELPKVPYLSDECERCAALKSAGVQAPTIRTTPYRSIRIAWGGDIMFLHELVGTNGPNAIYPCHVCLIDRETLQTVGVPPAKPPALRSIATAATHLLQLKTGPKKDQKRRSFSQVVAPIPTTEYSGNIAPSPLHVTLGLVKDLVVKLFEFAAALDERAIVNMRTASASRHCNYPASGHSASRYAPNNRCSATSITYDNRSMRTAKRAVNSCVSTRALQCVGQPHGNDWWNASTNSTRRARHGNTNSKRNPNS